MENRINGSVTNIDDDNVRNFFNGRSQKKLPHRYNLVNYQDDNPQLALQRDKMEKEKIVPFLDLHENDFVLDIGCGVGRWGDYIVPLLNDGKYVGIDYTEDFISIAKDQFKKLKNAGFVTGSFQNLTEKLKEEGEYRKYNKIIINGVLMYINDDDIDRCIDMTRELLCDGGIVYLKESVGINDRLTLKDFYSKELTASYNVIYRSVKEYSKMIFNKFVKNGYSVMCCGPTWSDGIDYSAQTSNWYWIIRA